MYDAIALLAISQLVCLGGLAYLFVQVQKMREGASRRAEAQAPAMRHRRPAQPAPAPVAASASRPAAAAARSSSEVAAELAGMGVDIPALARRMNRSEEEVRLLLRRQGAVRS